MSSRHNRKNKNSKSSSLSQEPDAKKMKMALIIPKIEDDTLAAKFILTDQVKESVDLLQWSIDQGVCILLSGPVGSGKTALVEHVALQMKKKLVKVQISDDTDARTLLGGYCCTEIPGRFEWRQGPLLSAMVGGMWLLLEDVACGQTNLLGLIRPLLEATALGLRSSLPDPMQPQNNVYAHSDFRIIVTQSLITLSHGYAEPRIASTAYGSNCLSKCQPIVLHSISPTSLHQIITCNHPSLVTLLPKLIGDQSLLQFVTIPAETKEQSRVNSARDLFNFCRRITNIDKRSDEQICTSYFLDASDCFIQHISDKGHRINILNYIGSVFNLNQTNVESILNHRICKIFGDAVEDSIINIGRVQLRRKTKGIKDYINPSHYFAQTRQMMQLLESLARCVQMQEPVLLVSETGCGKTSTVQYLSKLVNRKLTVINMNQQSDSSDLLGGYKPVNNAFSEKEIENLTAEITDIVEQFKVVFKATFSSEQNNLFLLHVKNTQEAKDYEKLVNLVGNEVISKAVFAISILSEELRNEWTSFYLAIEEIKNKMTKLKCNLTFSFIEGALVQAVKNGDWVLLDEINLAPPEMLQSLSGLLESATGSLTLVEKGDKMPIERHRDFRLFACMNPATDVGKRNLPQGLRNRFTEIYLHELTDLEELSIIVKHYMGSLSHKNVECVVKFYLALRDSVHTNKMVDGGGSRPQFSLRTLCRALQEIKHFYEYELYRTTISRALFEGLSFSFKCQLSDDSRVMFDQLFESFFNCQLKSIETKSVLSKNVTEEMLAKKGFKLIMGYPVKLGPNYCSNVADTDEFVRGYKITSSVAKNLKDLARIVSGGKTLPVLVQGETSVGKTSLITYLARLTGHVCHRVNNHESTDIQEYLGCYVGGEGKLVFKEGLLAQAMREGHWIILDELNLAPTDILEALNRVLDDNRELFIAETQTIITAHSMFRVFATQNPPGLYGGRKVLSRALRNRFIELHFNPIPNEELVEILDECCKMPRSRGVKMVETMRLLQSDSKELDVVHCKRSYISLRDLFRWARRVYYEHSRSSVTFDWDRHMVEEGYLLLTGKARSEEEVNLVAKILKQVFKNVDVQLNDDWFFSKDGSNIGRSILGRCEQVTEIANIEWTHDFRRMAVLLIRAIECNEPALLVGNTGCGKTTICHLAATLNKQELLSINCHMHTEASDFLGGLRPYTNQNGEEKRLFQWVDGPLVIAMKEGKMFLIDEISLADDSVLERLNSVLESDRKLTLVENGEMSLKSDDNNQSIEIRAVNGFQVFATMNPGGDFGKKELSPALKNRFTEIWCPSNSWSTSERGLNDWVNIASRNLKDLTEEQTRHDTAKVLVHFLRAVNEMSTDIKFSVVSIRDLLSWVEFINLSRRSDMPLFESIVHGAYMVIIDSINDKINKSIFEKKLLGILHEQLDAFLPGVRTDAVFGVERYDLTTVDNKVGMSPFFIELGSASKDVAPVNYSFNSKTTGSNLWRLLRALQVSKKPLLLEGSPGVGKTSLVSQLAKLAGFKVVRINLSEQTDANDLFGCFLPIENGGAGELCWRDGPLLQALQNGDWILLDEMNLASQSVLESLNACLDHRGEIFVPELNRSFLVKPGQTRLFACQNPMSEGGGRKGLPKSFVNRFTQVYMSALQSEDYEEILTCLYPVVPGRTVQFMVRYVQSLKEQVTVLRKFGLKGSPWEFNLRDLCRWCDLMVTHQSAIYEPAFFASLLFVDRFRCDQDKVHARTLYNELAKEHAHAPLFMSGLELHVTEDVVRLGQAKLARSKTHDVDCAFLERNLLLRGQLASLESMMLTVGMGWMTILVGPSGAGKTSLVHALASVTGHRLQTMSMNSAMDTTDLLGSFEQQLDGGRFKWMDSMLVQALKAGDWLVLDTVNFCNASVLDRLNGLLEPNGSLLLTERGLLDGHKLEEVRPHPDFRIFLVLDPECGGEISKAMRNRGLELSFSAVAEQDTLSILTNVHRLSMSDARTIAGFQHLLKEARATIPQIRTGTVTSVLQAGSLVSRGHTTKQALTLVYGETQLSSSVRADVSRFVDTLEPEESEDRAQPTLTLAAVVGDPSRSLVARDLAVLCQTIEHCQPINRDDKVVLARLFIGVASRSDVHFRINAASFDEDLHQACRSLADIVMQCPSKMSSDLPVDPRHLPCWSDLQSLDFSPENVTLFALCNYGNELLEQPGLSERVEKVRPRDLDKDTIKGYNVEEISHFFSKGKLSRGLAATFGGLDSQTAEFIELVKTIDLAGLCDVDNTYILMKVCKMVNKFCGFMPGQNRRWLSTYFYHVSAVAGLMQSHVALSGVCRQILTKLDRLDVSQYAQLVDHDELKISAIKRTLLRSTYPHSELMETEEQHTSMVEYRNTNNQESIWRATNEDNLRSVLLKTFSRISGTEMNINDIANNFSTETIKIWPFMFNMMSFVLNSLAPGEGVKQLIAFFNDLSQSQFHLPSLPCDLQKRIQKMVTSSEYTLITDWVKYLISQSHINNILASCSFQMNRDTEEFELRFEFPSGFLKPDIANLWSRPDNTIFLLISGIENQSDAVTYFNSLKHIDLAKRNLKSVKERKLQLEFCKETLLECSSVLSTDQIRIKNEMNTMGEMMALQRGCIMSCHDASNDPETWLAVVAPWFVSLEKDFNETKSNLEATSLRDLGKLWVRWGVIQMKLFAIMEPLDPQTQLYWDNLYLKEELTMMQREEKLSKTYREILSGVDQEERGSYGWAQFGAQHPLLHVTWSRITELQEKVSRLTPNIGLRPVGDDKYTQLRQHTLRFLSKYGWAALCDEKLTTVKELDSGFTVEWSMAASELLNFMLEESESIAFPDLVEAFALGVSRTLTGLSMLSGERSGERSDERSGGDPRKASVSRIVGLFCQFPNFNGLDTVSQIMDEESEIMEDVEVLLGKCDSKTKGRIHIKLLHLCLRMLLFYKNNELKSKKNEARMMELLHKVLSIFESLWKKQEEKRIEKAEAEGSVYIKKQKATENLTDEEIEELEVYLNVSPKNEEIDNMEMSAAMNTAANQIRRMREQLESLGDGLLLTDDTVHSVVRIASEMLCTEAKESDRSVFRDCYRFAAALVSCHPANMVEADKGLLVAHLAALSWEVEIAETGDQAILSERPYDIYQDPVHARDLYSAGSALDNLRQSLTKLLATYPDNAALLAVEKKMNSILQLSLEFPLIVFISNVERLIHEIQQWEIVAARHVSLREHVSELNKLLVSWRRSELHMWSSTLTTASWKLDYDVSLEFLNFYHILMTELSNPNVVDHVLSVNAVLEPLIGSISSAKLGNYRAKLDLFRLLIASLDSVSTVNSELRTKLAHTLANHHDYYRLYLASFEQQIEAEYKKIGKELKEFIKTQKWGDAPPRSTGVSKCHKIVFKYLRQWNSVIHRPCGAVMELAPINALNQVRLVEAAKEARLSRWSTEMLSYFKDMWETMENFRRENKELELKAGVESKETEGKELLEKKWRALVKNLQQRKRNSVTNFVKHLKELGMRIIGTRFPAATALMTHLPLGDVVGDGTSTIRCIGLRLRLDTADKSEEFAKFNDFKSRLVCICDDWLGRVCTSSTRIVGRERALLATRAAVDELAQSLCHEVVSRTHAGLVEEQLGAMDSHHSELLGQWKEFFGRVAPQVHLGHKFPRMIPEQMRSEVSLGGPDNVAKDSLDKILTKLRHTQTQGGFLTTQRHVDGIDRQHQTVADIRDLIQSINDQFGTRSTRVCSSVVEHLRCVNDRHQRELVSIEGLVHEATTGSFTGTSRLIKIIEESILTLNGKMQDFRRVEMDGEEDLSFNHISGHVESLESVIDHDTIRDTLMEVRRCLRDMSVEDLNESRVRINESLLALLQAVLAMDEEYLRVAKNYHQVLVSGLDALLTVTAALIKDGFCVPDDSVWGEQSEDNTNKPEKFNNFEMAGMDDGTGTNDVSDQIESESQLEGTNKDEHKEQPEDQPDVPDEEDGIEMSDDFQGKTHDPKVEENDQNEENENKDELEELEDKMGEVGDAQETDLNKQSWDEEKEDEEADKNDDERNGGVSKDDTPETVADNKENKDMKENAENTQNKKEPEENGEEEPNEETFNEINDTVEDKDGPEERPEPTQNEPEKEAEAEDVDEKNPLEELFDNEEKIDDDGQNEEGSEKVGDVQEEMQVDGEEENVDDLKGKEEKIEEETKSDELDQSVNIAGGNDAADADEEMNYDTEMGETDKDEATNGNGSSNNQSTTVQSNTGRMNDKLPGEDSEESPQDQTDEKKDSAENRTMGDKEQSFKRKADVMDANENVDPKKQKITDAFAHVDPETGDDDGAEQVLDDATADQQQHIPEENDEEMDTKQITKKEEKEKRENEIVDNMESNGQVREKEKVEKEKESVGAVAEEMKEKRLSWSHYESKGDYLARQLCEQLRNVLEPTKSNKLGGAFRTGKRLDMKKVIPYIASGFRKDKIWLRRNKPSQREYQVLVAVDNSKSMKYNVGHDLFFESLSILLNGLTFLEVGQVGVCKFGSSTEVLLPLHQQFSSEIGEQLVEAFDFKDGSSKYIPILERALELFSESRHTLSSSAAPETSQLLLLLSDGDVTEDVEDPRFRTLTREAHNRGIFIVVIMIDQADPALSIYNSKLFINGGTEYVRYLDVFPLPNYTVIQDVSKIPSLLTEVLTQWFELASSGDKGPSRG